MEKGLVLDAPLGFNTFADYYSNKIRGNFDEFNKQWHSTVPYEFEEKLNQDSLFTMKKKLIKKTIDYFNEIAQRNLILLEFSPKKPNDRYYVRFIHDKHVSEANVGKTIGAKKDLTALNPISTDVKIANWATQKDILHEMMHVLGFQHEHQRIDLNVDVRPEESRTVVDSKTKEWLNMNIQAPTGIPLTPYDPDSIMHYPVTFYYDSVKWKLFVNKKLMQEYKKEDISKSENSEETL